MSPRSLLIATVLAVSACGQTGPLYLPEDDSEAAVGAEQAEPASEEQEDETADDDG